MAFPTRVRHQGRSARRGFTLLELMIAMAAGLIIAVTAFSFSRQATRLFAAEARVAAAQMGVLAGFQKLQSELARASYMSSSNFARDASFNRICDYTGGNFPQALVGAAGLQIVVAGSQGAPSVTALPDGQFPDRVRIIGNLTSAEAYSVLAIEPGGSGHNVYLRMNDGPSSRSGFDNAASFQAVFAPGRVLRILDQQGHQHYQSIAAATWGAGTQPFVTTSLPFAMKGEGANPMCAIDGLGTMTQANVVSIVEYGITGLGQLNSAAYNSTIYAAGAHAPGDETRTELVRREVVLGNAGVPFYADPSATVIAEYAVDLRFGVWTSNTNIAGCTAPAVGLRFCPPSSSGITNVMAPGNAFIQLAQGPESVHAVQMRLVTRSREVDRSADLPSSNTNAHGSIHRFKVGELGWARARTLVADVSLPNQRGDVW